MHPVPSEAALVDYYARAYRADGSFGARNVNSDCFPKDDLWLYHRGLSVADFFRTRVRIPSPRRMMDIGAGYGHILHFLRDVFPRSELWAAELDENCIAHLKGIGLPVLRPSGDLQKTVGEGFDLIICSHVVEHFVNPVGRVREIKEMLRNGGYLYIEVPHCPARWLRRNTWHDEPHITFFDIASVRKLAMRSGLEILFLDTVGPRLEIEPRPPIRLNGIRRIAPAWVKQLWRAMALRVRCGETSPSTPNPNDSGSGAFREFAQYGGQRLWIRLLLQRSQ